MTKVQPKKCFVISPIGSLGSATRMAADFFLKGIVREAFKLVDFPIEATRSDEINNPSLITSSVINAIIDSDFIIADLSELNPNVFYELGVAHTNEKPIIHCANDKTDIPFDNKDYSTIFYNITDWASIEYTRIAIKDHVNKIYSKDYTVSNPITHALGLRRIQTSADPKERIIAEMLERIENIEISFRSISSKNIKSSNYQIAHKRDLNNIPEINIINYLNNAIYSVAFANSIIIGENEVRQLIDRYTTSLDAANIISLISNSDKDFNQMILEDIRRLGNV